MEQPRRDKAAGVIGTALMLGLFGLLMASLGGGLQKVKDSTLTLLNLAAPPPPPPLHTEAPKRARSAGAAPKATTPDKPAPAKPVVREVIPPVVTPLPVPAAPASGARGTGTGGGTGGLGSGSAGEGDGDGDGGDSPPEQVKGRLKFSDMPPDIRASGATGTVGVRYHVNVDGRVSDCVATRSSGIRELDDLTCRLIEQRFRFEPSRDYRGRPVRSTVVENHSWLRARDGDPDDGDGG